MFWLLIGIIMDFIEVCIVNKYNYYLKNNIKILYLWINFIFYFKLLIDSFKNVNMLGVKVWILLINVNFRLVLILK